jgi:HD-like signal output (HDOD) protein
MAPDELDGLVREIAEVPEAYRPLFAAVGDPDAAVARVVETINADAGLTAKVLQFVNTVFADDRRPFESLTRAVVILGFRTVRNAALSLGVFEFLREVPGGNAFARDRLWIHNIGVATVAKVLAGECRAAGQADEAFFVGLLHDVGKLLLWRNFPADYHDLLARAQTDRSTWYQAELATLQLNHASLAGALLASWDFPPSLVDAIAFHHQPIQAAEAVLLASLLHVADAAAYELELGSPGSRAPGAPDAEAVQLLDVTLPVSEEVEERIQRELERFTGVLELIL